MGSWVAMGSSAGMGPREAPEAPPPPLPGPEQAREGARAGTGCFSSLCGFLTSPLGPFENSVASPGPTKPREKRGERFVGFRTPQIPGYLQLWEEEVVNISGVEGDLGVPEPPRFAEELMPILASPKNLWLPPGLGWGKVLSWHIPSSGIPGTPHTPARARGAPAGLDPGRAEALIDCALINCSESRSGMLMRQLFSIDSVVFLLEGEVDGASHPILLHHPWMLQSLGGGSGVGSQHLGTAPCNHHLFPSQLSQGFC